MERQLYVNPLKKHFTINVKDAVKNARNRSFANASNCHGAKVIQRKVCSVCDADVDVTQTTRKIVKLGKEEHLINAQSLKQIQDSLKEDTEIKIHTILKELPDQISDMNGGFVWITSAKKKADFYELKELLQDFFMVGKANFRGNEYEIILYTGKDGRVRMNKLVEQSQIYDKPEVEEGVVSEQVVALEKNILDKQATTNYDFTEFRDTRTETEDKMIEDLVIHGKQLEIQSQTINEVEKKSESEELERLKALM